MAENPGRLLPPTIDADLAADSGSLIDPPTDAHAGEPDPMDDPGPADAAVLDHRDLHWDQRQGVQG